MLPSHSGKLKLSKLNMGGAGSWMMRLINEKQKDIQSGRIDATGWSTTWCGDDCLYDEYGCDGRKRGRTTGQRCLLEG